MKGVLLSGGTGSRLRPITHTGPKQLIPVANKPVLQYAIEDLREAGITEIGIVLGNKSREEVQQFLGDGSKFGVEITYIVQGDPLGIAHAIGCTRDFIGNDDFVVYLGDNILRQPIEPLLDSFKRGEYAGGIALQEVDNPERFGVVDLDEDDNVVQIVEKPDDPPSNVAIIGIYILSPLAFEAIEEITPSWRNELEITDVFQWLIDHDEVIDSHTVEGWWKDTGKPKDIISANRLILGEMSSSIDGTIEEGAETMGTIELHETATVESGAVVRGPVSIDAGTVIKDETYLGPYTSIGPNSTIENTHIENSVIVGNSTIRTYDKIVDSLIGQGTDIKNGNDKKPEGRRLVVGEDSNLGF
ncbi:dTDP-glucose pyrophosphorylase [Halalkaliarchaeum sp. AArc-CO]|uniref:glucose-1-phosphate thymidylyltransferase n=1 Tax=Halalkaliarchaeum sp. AArc-CO TaxID=2866381 RepID=UPI00217EF61E|nr:glucose-1-phosphate thymidylyltransferase [Halalkaliarchaeum sp. AArc-CO]UWG50167.1 dTDP-glucose pyrophosphorylase [Halalkaliarchaeum sp. AArc-CO]